MWFSKSTANQISGAWSLSCGHTGVTQPTVTLATATPDTFARPSLVTSITTAYITKPGLNETKMFP